MILLIIIAHADINIQFLFFPLGNCCTILLACVSPADKNVAESESTLQYAQTTRKIQNKNVQGTVALSMSPSEGASLRKENKKLKALLIDLVEQCSHRGGRNVATGSCSLKKKEQSKNQSKNGIWQLKENIGQIIMQRDDFMNEVDRLKSERSFNMVQKKNECEALVEIVSLKQNIEQLNNEKANLEMHIESLTKELIEEICCSNLPS